MNQSCFLKHLFCLILLQLMSNSYAVGPLWTFTPLTLTSRTLPVNSTAVVQYKVTNKSAHLRSLNMLPINGVTQLTNGAGVCGNPFNLAAEGYCTLSLQIDANKVESGAKNGPTVCSQGSTLQCYQPEANDILNITVTSASQSFLVASVQTLTLSVADTNLNAALTGTPRVITITNTGNSAALNVSYSPSPALPAGTTISPACGTIAPSASCTLTITPGANPSAAPGDTNPVPITLSIAGTNTNTLTPTLNILTYGSVYQGGYIYAVDDTTPTGGNIGGKAVTLFDQTSPSSGIIWSSDVLGHVNFTAIYAVSENSTILQPSPSAGQIPGQTSCNGNQDGFCTSTNIYAYSSVVNNNFYALGLCKTTISGQSDWYLPAICELGYGDPNSGCGMASSPTAQNMQSNLVENGNIGSLSATYWSSTQDSGSPALRAWSQGFSTSGGLQGVLAKSSLTQVRCSRTIN